MHIREQMVKEGLGHVPDQVARELEAAFDLKLQEGHDPELSFMAHLWQDVRCHYRSDATSTRKPSYSSLLILSFFTSTYG
jgi:hypothetical protein